MAAGGISGSAASVVVRTRSAASAAAHAAKRAERGRHLFHKLAAGVKAKAGPFVLSSKGMVAFAVCAAAVMVVSGADNQFQAAHAPALADQTGGANTFNNSSSAPYVLPASEYPAPSAIVQDGNNSLPRLASTVVGGTPTFLLLTAGGAYSIETLSASVRIFGEPFNAVNASLLENGSLVENGTDLRLPGPPNGLNLSSLSVAPGQNYTAWIHFQPNFCDVGKGGPQPGSVCCPKNATASVAGHGSPPCCYSPGGWGADPAHGGNCCSQGRDSPAGGSWWCCWQDDAASVSDGGGTPCCWQGGGWSVAAPSGDPCCWNSWDTGTASQDGGDRCCWMWDGAADGSGHGCPNANPVTLTINLTGAFDTSRTYSHTFQVQPPRHHHLSYFWNVSLASLLEAGFANVSGSVLGVEGTHLYLQEGTYSSSLALAELKGSSSGVPVAWSIPSPVPGFRSYPSGDALSINGSMAVVAGSSNGATRVVESGDLGTTWRALGSFAGNSPELAERGLAALLTTVGSGDTLYVSTLPLGGGASTSVALGSVYGAAPVLPGDGSEGIVASLIDNQSVVYYRSVDGGVSFASFPIASFAVASTSAIFDAIGDTSLATPGGIPGQVAVAPVGDEGVAILYTTSVGGQVVAAIASSADAGTAWSGPYLTTESVSSLQDPEMVASSSGFLYVAWRDDGTGYWQVDQSVYSPDGSVVQEPSPLPGSQYASAPTLALDMLERPLFVWSAGYGAGSELEVSGALPSSSSSATFLSQAIDALVPGEFTPANATNGPSLQAQATTLVSEVLAGQDAAAVHTLVGSIYPEVSSSPLSLVCPSPYAGSSPSPTPCGPVRVGTGLQWLANISGVLSPSTYLGVYADWLLESLGVGVLTPPPGDATVSSGGATLSVVPTGIDPTTAILNVSYTFPAYNVHDPIIIPPGGGIPTGCGTSNPSCVGIKPVCTITNEDVATSFNLTVSGQGLTTNASVLEVVVQDLAVSAASAWSVFVQAHYSNVTVYDCKETVNGVTTHTVGTTIHNSTGQLQNLSLSGTVSTALSISPNPPSILVQTGSSGTYANVGWATDLLATGQANLTVVSSGPTQTLNDNYRGFHEAYQFSLSQGSYDASGYSSSVTGPVPSFGCGGKACAEFNLTTPGGPASGGEHASWSCSFTYSGVSARVWGLSFTSLASSTEATFYSNDNEPASLRYFFFGSAENVTQSGIQPVSTNAFGNGTIEYTIVLPYVEAFAVLTVTASLPAGSSGCLSFLAVDTASFSTPTTTFVPEHDLPYDSITLEGGGADLTWNVPKFFAQASTFVDGNVAVNVCGSSGTTNYPIESLRNITGDPESFSYNLTALTPGDSYCGSLEANYSYHGGVVTVEGGLGFPYLYSTSGDGLADSEKGYGWVVTYTDSAGDTETEYARPSVADVATNLLTGDYVEKEFGLDPNTIDSAGSHMLDVWNMTFVLGSYGLPAGFEAWNESGCLYGSTTPCLDPFEAAPYPGGTAPGTPAQISPGNFTQGGIGLETDAPDSSPWASTVLWTYGDLESLSAMVAADGVGWLRGVTGDYDGTQTFTVWGKLSWGADPLAASTPSDGIADGARVNPLHEVDLQIDIPHAGTQGAACLFLTSGWGFAVRYYVNQSTASGTGEFEGYSAQGWAQGTGCATVLGVPGPIGDYSVVTPVVQTVQDQSIQLQFVVNTSTCGLACSGVGSLYQLPFGPFPTPCSDTLSLVADMASPSEAPLTASSPAKNYTGNYHCATLTPPFEQDVGGTYVDIATAPVAAGVKDPTYLYVPSDNSTLSNLPLGLDRYTGEQDFVLLAVNFTTYINGGSNNGALCSCQAVTVNVPEPWGNINYARTYTVSAGQGMVNFLVPRGAFLNSPLGQAVLSDHMAQYTGPASNVPVLGGSMAQLECDWEAYGTGGGSSDLCTGGASAPSVSGFTTLKVAADSTNCSVTTNTNCLAGGVLSNPQLEASNPAPSLQSIIAFNSSLYQPSGTGYASEPQALEEIIAGLLDNSTGGLNGSLMPVTDYLPSFGLNGVILSALANASYDSSGVYGNPISLADPGHDPAGVLAALLAHPDLSFSFLVDLWNSACGLLLGLIERIPGLEEIGGIIWSAAEAAEVYIDQVAHALAKFAVDLVQATVAALKAAGQALVGALDFLVKVVIQLIDALAQATFSVLWKGLSAAETAVEKLFEDAASSFVAAQNGAAGFSSYVGAEALAVVPFLAIGIALTVLMDILLGITAPVSLAVSFIAGAVISAVIAAAGAGSTNTSHEGFLGTIESTVSGFTSDAAGVLARLTETALNFTWQDVEQVSFSTADVHFIGDPGDDVGGWTLGFGVESFIVALYQGLVAKIGDLAAQLGFALGLVSFVLGAFFFFTVGVSGCDNLPALLDQALLGMAITEGAASIFSLPLDIYGLVSGRTPQSKIAAGLSAGIFDPIGLYGSALDIQATMACQATAT